MFILQILISECYNKQSYWHFQVRKLQKIYLMVNVKYLINIKLEVKRLS
jgi:hypothetical protein